MSEAWEKINQLVKDYRFDQRVLDDIYNRLRDCQDEAYAKQTAVKVFRKLYQIRKGSEEMRFIKLTEVKRTHGNFERYFNADKIENFKRMAASTYLYMSTSSAAYEVVETPEEIIELIKQAKEL